MADWLEEGLSWALLVAAVLSSLLNGAVLALAARLLSQSSHKVRSFLPPRCSSHKRMRSSQGGHVFIASMTVANLLLTLLFYPIKILAKRIGLVVAFL